MRDAKGMPEHDIGVGDGFGAVADPLGDSLSGLTRGLRDVVTRDPELVVPV